MIHCRNKLATTVLPKGINSTYSGLAYAGFGWPGVYFVDLATFVTLIGVCIAYQINFGTLLHDIPQISSVVSVDSCIIISALIVFPISCAKDLSALSSMSSIGLACIFINLFAIFAFGLSRFGDHIWSSSSADPSGGTQTNITLFPESLSALTQYAGIAIFCFGICLLAFPVEESMADKREFPQALGSSLLFVCIIYTIVGDGAAYLYSFDSAGGGVKGNILLNLPQDSVAATIIRLSMCGVSSSKQTLLYKLSFLKQNKTKQLLLLPDS